MFRVLVPVDHDVGRALAQVQFVASLPAETDTLGVTLLHSFHGDERRQPVSLQQADNVRSVRRAKTYLREHGIDADVEDVREPVHEGIVEFADDVDADLIVMGGRKRSGVEEAVFGSVTRAVMRGTDRPVTVTGTAEE